MKKIFSSFSSEKLHEIPAEELKEFKQQILDMQTRLLELEDENTKLRNLQPEATPTAPADPFSPPADASSHSASTFITSDKSKFINNLLQEITDYDGKTNPRFFIASVWRCVKLLKNVDEQDTLIRRIIAQKLKGPAQITVQRLETASFREISSALHIHFGRSELSYQQLSDLRNSTCQGATETAQNYIKRYEDIHIRLQAAIDNIQEKHRESIRFLEESTHIEKFIESLRPELEIRVANKRPKTLREAFAEAQRIDKKMQDQNTLRQRYSSKSTNRYNNNNSSTNTPSFSSTQSSQPRPAPPRTNIQFNNPGTRTYYCTHCKMTGHSDLKCFKLHPELKRNFPVRQHTAESPTEPEPLMEIQQNPIETEVNYETAQYCTSVTSDMESAVDFW